MLVGELEHAVVLDDVLVIVLVREFVPELVDELGIVLANAHLLFLVPLVVLVHWPALVVVVLVIVLAGVLVSGREREPVQPVLQVHVCVRVRMLALASENDDPRLVLVR